MTGGDQGLQISCPPMVRLDCQKFFELSVGLLVAALLIECLCQRIMGHPGSGITLQRLFQGQLGFGSFAELQLQQPDIEGRGTVFRIQFAGELVVLQGGLTFVFPEKMPRQAGGGNPGRAAHALAVLFIENSAG